uniref:Uncharacterized protein n=1 Tax=Streptomyces lividans 1326 TaxID=1200984 RepID=Q848C6_STRLI|nr:hypothetical protein [Streptomyces lividans 1326]
MTLRPLRSRSHGACGPEVTSAALQPPGGAARHNGRTRCAGRPTGLRPERLQGPGLVWTGCQQTTCSAPRRSTIGARLTRGKGDGPSGVSVTTDARQLVRGSVVHGPARCGNGETPQGEARGDEQYGEDGQEENGHPHLPAPRSLPTRPGSAPRPQQNGRSVEGADPAQLPHGPQELDAFGLRCHAAPCTPDA